MELAATSTPSCLHQPPSGTALEWGHTGGVQQQDGAHHLLAHGGDHPRFRLPQPAGPPPPRVDHPAESRALRNAQDADPARRLRRHQPLEDGVEALQPHGLRPRQRGPAAPLPARRRLQAGPAEGVRRGGGRRLRPRSPQPAQRLVQGRGSPQPEHRGPGRPQSVSVLLMFRSLLVQPPACCETLPVSIHWSPWKFSKRQWDKERTG